MIVPEGRLIMFDPCVITWFLPVCSLQPWAHWHDASTTWISSHKGAQRDFSAQLWDQDMEDYFFFAAFFFFLGSCFSDFLLLCNLLLCFSASLLFCFSAFLLLWFSASLQSASLLFLLLCFSASLFSLFLCFSASLLFLLLCFSCFSAFLLLCFSASLLFLLLCFSASLFSLFLCFCTSVPFYFYYSTFSFSSVMCFCCSTSCSFASLLPVFILSCLYPKWNPRETLGETQRNPKEILIRHYMKP